MKLFLLTLLLLPLTVIGAGNRVALVIGCSRYTNLSEGKQLTSPVADATDVAAELKALGYTLVNGGAVTDAGKDDIITATESFATQAKDAEAAVFYFSGHGLQVGDDNFLMPSDTPRITSYTVLKNRGVHLRDAVMVALEEAKARTKVIILDCCRENPFAEQVDQALAQVSKNLRTKGGLGEISGYGPGFFLAFATSPGTLADDGNGRRNSPFTAALLTHLKTSAGEDITPLFRKVKATVRQGSGEDQVPWTNDSLDTSFALGPVSQPSPSSEPASQPPTMVAPNYRSKPDDLWADVVGRGLRALTGKPDATEKPTPVETPPSEEIINLPPSGYFDLDSIFDGTPYDAYNRQSRVEILKRAQEQLKGFGLYHSTADGGMGPGTQQAIVNWQRRQKLPLSAKLDNATLASLTLLGLAETPVSRPVSSPSTPRTTSKPQSRPTQTPRSTVTPPPAAKPPAGNQDDAFREAARKLDRL